MITASSSLLNISFVVKWYQTQLTCHGALPLAGPFLSKVCFCKSRRSYATNAKRFG